jgi:hypothetical protein
MCDGKRVVSACGSRRKTFKILLSFDTLLIEKPAIESNIPAKL